jgi:two-component system, NtrC family, response regulator AtoC
VQNVSIDACVQALRERLQQQTRYTFLAGEGMVEVLELIARVADTDVPVLVCGESGTGKELVARALHACSGRREHPFVKVNCAALPAELLESELFGFERGAFTGAIQQKPGKFEFANHGTMFLDEIGEMSPQLQAKLLQVLQDGEFSRLGGKSDVRVDARIIAATNRDLERGVAAGQFRQDLFFRLDVVRIVLPPLRERRTEIPMFVDYFLDRLSRQYNKTRPTLSSEMLGLFMQYPWPGNVRELENVLKRAVILGTEAPIRKEMLQAITPRPSHEPPGANPGTAGAAADAGSQPSMGRRSTDTPPADRRRVSLKDIARTAAREAERAAILRTLQQTRWNRKEAASLLGISYKALLYKIKESGLDKSS